MFEILRDVINYSGDWTTNYNSYIVQGCIAIVIIGVVLTMDFIYKVFLSFMARRDK